MLNGTVEGHLNVQRLYETVARILGAQYGVKLTPTVKPKVKPPETETAEQERPVAVSRPQAGLPYPAVPVR